MSFKLKEGSIVDIVALKVKDIEKEITFFKDVLGLDLLREENGMAFIGIKETKKSLLCLLEKPDGIVSVTSHNGLYHLALLLPTRKELSELFQHLLTLDYPIVGLSDNGHSEAIYLKDPEFNGIKLYWDKPRAEWDFHTEGTMDGVLSRLDSQSLLAESTDKFEKIPTETRLGHVHLNVADLDKTQKFYVQKLGLVLTSKEFPSLRYLAAGDYHQHIAINTLNQVKEEDHDDENFGLDYIGFKLTTNEELLALKAHLEDLEEEFFYNKGKNILRIDDPNGIHILFHSDDIKK